MSGSCRWSGVLPRPTAHADRAAMRLVEQDSPDPYTAGMIRRSLVPVAAGLVVCFMLAACSMGSNMPLLANPDPASNPPSTSTGRSVPGDGVVAVRPGDTVYALARRYGVSPRTIIETNRLSPPYLLQVGDRLLLPTPQEHVVRAGDTVSEIAQNYGVDFRRFVALNDLRPPYAIRVGQRLRLPGTTDGSQGGIVTARTPQRPPVAAAAEPAPRDPTQPWSGDGTLSFPVIGSPAPSGQAGGPPVPAPRPSARVAVTRAPSSSVPQPAPRSAAGDEPSRASVLTPPPRGGGRFLWPVEGRVVAGFGPREGGLHNDGINIEAAHGTRIRAAENGVVVYAGNELRGFGNLLLIKHADGWTTAYAHADTLLVRRGDRVSRGQPIATVGQTGNVDSPQLHFEIRKGPRAVDPRDELAAVRASSRAVDGRSVHA